MTGSIDRKALENARTRAYVAEMPPAQVAEKISGFVLSMASVASDICRFEGLRGSLSIAVPAQPPDEYIAYLSGLIQEEFRKTFGHEMIWKEPE